MPVSLQPDESYDFTLLIDGTVAVLYINDQMALSTRMYDLPEHQWGIFSAGSEVTLTGLQTSTLLVIVSIPPETEALTIQE